MEVQEFLGGQRIHNNCSASCRRTQRNFLTVIGKTYEIKLRSSTKIQRTLKRTKDEFFGAREYNWTKKFNRNF